MTTEERYRINEINFKIICDIKYNYRHDLKDVINYFRSLTIFMDFDISVILNLSKLINEGRFNILKHEKVHWLNAQGLTNNAIHALAGISSPTVKKYLEIPIFPKFDPQYREALDDFMKQHERLCPLNVNTIVDWGCENV